MIFYIRPVGRRGGFFFAKVRELSIIKKDTKGECFVETMRQFFKNLVARVFVRHQMERKLSKREYEATEEYLVSLLLKFMRDDEQILFEPLLQHLHEILNDSKREKGWRRFMEMRDIGDASLFIAGILHSRAIRSMVGIRHYINVGESVYGVLLMNLDKKDNLSVVYQRFAKDLNPFVHVLSEIGHEHIFHNKLNDIVFIWERYAKHGKKEDLEWLKDHGVALLPEFYERR